MSKPWGYYYFKFWCGCSTQGSDPKRLTDFENKYKNGQNSTKITGGKRSNSYENSGQKYWVGVKHVGQNLGNLKKGQRRWTCLQWSI